MDLGCPLLRGSFVRRLRRRAATTSIIGNNPWCPKFLEHAENQRYRKTTPTKTKGSSSKNMLQLKEVQLENRRKTEWTKKRKLQNVLRELGFK